MSGFRRPDRHRTPTFTRATHLGTSKPDLERDSGFSDASSGYLSAVDLTDSEDAGRIGSGGSQDTTTPQVAVMGGSYGGLSPMIIMNNFVLKQPSQMAPAEKQWGFSSPLEMMPQSQVVLLQPMVPNGGSSSSPKTENTRQSKPYMPILKSYPRIAPHPGEASAKRCGSPRMRGSSASGYDRRQRRRHHHGHRLYGSHSPQLAPQTPPSKPAGDFETANNLAQVGEPHEQLSNKFLPPSVGTGSPFPYAFRAGADSDGAHGSEEQDAFSTNTDKRQRFSNTYNILDKCGLLGITMRTKQLMKENKHTQGQLQQLQEQTALLLEALSSGDPQLWAKLQRSLQDTDKDHSGIKSQRVFA